MKATPIFAFPFPESTDPPAGNAQIEGAVEKVEDVLAQIEELLLGAPAPGNLVIVNGTSDPVYKEATGDVTNNSAGVFSIGGEKVVTGQIKALAVTAAKLAAEAVETAKIQNLAVTEGKLAALAVSAAKLAAEAVETGKIKNLAVTEAKIAAEAVSRAKLAKAARPVRWYTPLEIAAEETRENVAYGTMTTPDQIAGVEVEAGSAILVGYTALWQSSKAKGRAAIFCGANQLKIVEDAGLQPVTTAAVMGTEASGAILTTFPGGLVGSSNAASGIAVHEGVNTGTAMGFYAGEAIPYGIEINAVVKSFAVKGAPLGGFCIIHGLAAGTYTLSVQYKSSEGNVKVKGRRLQVGVIGAPA